MCRAFSYPSIGEYVPVLCIYPYSLTLTFNFLLVIEGKGLMSREPGICDPYVKVSAGLEAGVGY